MPDVMLGRSLDRRLEMGGGAFVMPVELRRASLGCGCAGFGANGPPDPTGPVLAQQSGDHQSAAVCSPSWAGHPGHECRSLPERRLWLIERSGRTPTNPLFWG